jgi:hypothetical protein
MTTQLQSSIRRMTAALIAAAFWIGLFATGVWAGSDANERPIAGDLGADPRVVAHLHVRILAFGGLRR